MKTKKCEWCRKIKPFNKFKNDGTYCDIICFECEEIIHKAYKQKDIQKKEKEKALKYKKIIADEKYIKQCKDHIKQLYTRKLSSSISGSISGSLKGNKNGNKWEEIVGYNLQEFIKHMKLKFKPGMSLKNHGKWHIDHIIPISLWDFSSYTDKEFKQCWALSNLQPLWAKENLIKSNNIIKGNWGYD